MRIGRLAALAGLIVCLSPEAALANFDECKSQLAALALEHGIAPATVESVFPDLTELPRVIANDRAQPEFTLTFTEYYQQRVTEHRMTEGRRLVREHAQLLDRIQRDTGVPPHYLVALWGLETNFGAYFGTLPIPSALATLACDTRRSAFFRREFLAVLEIVQRGDIAAAALKGSWAGAIGHMQFMPTTFLAHAIDADDDGRRDLIGNLADALASGAAYLSSLGWQSGYRWGREVTLPAQFDFAQAGLPQWRSIAAWRDLGLGDAFGKPLPPMDLEAALIVPAGHTGPAFLVYPNFRAIMGWNRSEAYAITVGRLADRIAGAGRLHRPLPPVEALQIPIKQIVQLQARLNAIGYDAGEPDGIIGPSTRKAVSDFQRANRLIADGFPDQDTRDLLFRMGTN